MSVTTSADLYRALVAALENADRARVEALKEMLDGFRTSFPGADLKAPPFALRLLQAIDDAAI